MKHRGKNLALLLTGVLIGCAIGGPAAHDAAVVIEAYRSSHPIYVDGARVELEAYAINGNNYVKLRDVGEAVGFNVYWDGSAARIESDKPYTGAPPVEETTEEPAAPPITADVNPAALTGAYTREAYEALRHTVMTGAESTAVYMNEDTRTAMQEAAAAIGSWPGYHMKTTADGKTSFYAKRPGSYEDAAAYCQPFIDSLAGLSDREKVRQIAFFVCDRITYDGATYCSPRTALVSDAVCRSACMGYAHCFKFLCDMAGIPSIFTHSEDHQWNQVYVEGQWWHVDVTGTDAGDDTVWRGKLPILHDETYMQGADYVQSQPELTRFAKELLVPGSTK